MLDGLDDQLCDPLAPPDLERRRRIGVHEQDLELAAVPAVDQTGGVEARHAVFEGETTSGLDEARVAEWNRNGESGGDERPATTGQERHVLSRPQIDPGIARLGVAGQVEIGIETDDRYLQHGGETNQPSDRRSPLPTAVVPRFEAPAPGVTPMA